MSLVDNINALATRFGQELKAVGNEIAASGGGEVTDPNLVANINSLLMRQADDDYESGRTALDMKGGSFDIFADESKVQTKNDIEVLSLSDGNAYGIARVVNNSATDSSALDVEGSVDLGFFSPGDPFSSYPTGCTVNPAQDKIILCGNSGTYEVNLATAGDFTGSMTLDPTRYINRLSWSAFMKKDGTALFLDSIKYLLTTNGTISGGVSNVGGVSIFNTPNYITFTNKYNIVKEGQFRIRGFWINDAETYCYAICAMRWGITDAESAVFLVKTAFDVAGDMNTENLTTQQFFLLAYDSQVELGYSHQNSTSAPIHVTDDELRIYYEYFGKIRVIDLETAGDLDTAKVNPYETYTLNHPLYARYVGRCFTDGWFIGFNGHVRISSLPFLKQHPTTGSQTLKTEVIDLTTDLASNPTEVFASYEGHVPSDCSITLTLNDGTTDFTIATNEFDSFQPRAFGSRTITATWNFVTTNANRTPILDKYVIYFK